ncbi:NPHN-like protein [Mya arenaria]|uniref:NPHN-like protein n=1 Tax=Mya arenaria TaxID=6604 RepID=A0ABY7EC76_MYAAR|nr:NPHN-like protein [Mya arenaria]
MTVVTKLSDDSMVDYPAYFDVGITAVSMVLPSDHSVSVINNTTRQFRCETSAGNPQASVEWYKDNGTLDRADDTPITTGIETDTSASGTIIVTIGKLTLTVQRNDHDVGVYCRANNGGDWLYSSSAVLDVQYKPLTPKHSEVTYPVRVISGRSITLTCSSTGNPSPTYTWTFPGRGSQSGPMLTLASVQTAHTGDIACIAMNMLSPTGGTTVEKKRQATINLQVLCKFASCTIMYHRRDFYLDHCYTRGRHRPQHQLHQFRQPALDFVHMVNSWTWTSVWSQLISGQCPAPRRPRPVHSDGYKHNGSHRRKYGNRNWQHNVLIGPQVQPTGTHDILRGRDLNFKCPFVSGNPAKTSFVWTRSIDKRQWNSQIVSITSVQKSDDGIYTCTATNHMTPTGSPGLTGNHSGTLHLNVHDFHVTEHIGNFNVTKSEYSNVKFTCTVDSNPQASINIRKEGEIRRSVNNSTQLEYTIANLTCWDAGLYTCDGSKPRRPPGEDTQLTFTARHHEQVALKYTVFAYPVPSPSQFVWKRCKTTCAQLSNFPGKYEIKTTGLSSNLTILDIETGDYGVYSISVSNGIGKDLVENIYLKPAGPPDPPTEFHVIEESIGETQAILTWIPGFNNGLSQTFHLSYGTLIEFATITKVNISHNEFEKSINYTINKLEPEKQYYVELFASNAKGKSMRVNATFTTLVRIVNPMGPSAAIIGGSIGGVIFAVLIVGGVILGVIKLRKLDIPDVVENTMYVPAEDISRQINTSGADALYAQPNKTKASSSAAAAKKHGKKAYENKIFEDSSLENHELTENKKNVNKDGLVYADLDFPKPQKGQTPYIHGLDDRTVYEEVDLSRKADPLQDSDDNASGKNKN